MTSPCLSSWGGSITCGSRLCVEAISFDDLIMRYTQEGTVGSVGPPETGMEPHPLPRQHCNGDHRNPSRPPVHVIRAASRERATSAEMSSRDVLTKRTCSLL